MYHPERPGCRAIIHVDADAFFASCEQALNPAYRGKPVITGKERGIVSAASYEAKRMGVKRGVPLGTVKKICPNAIILPSDYESYSLFSKRMFDIIRKFTSEVEEYSIDEAFADITGLRRPLHKSYPQIALAIKTRVQKELGITVSIGLAATKVLTKIGSRWNKPSGFAYISHRDREAYLKKTPVEDIWGIGSQTMYYLKKYQIDSAWQFANQSEKWVEGYMTKPHQEIWHELNGRSIYKVSTAPKKEYKSISKTKTFSPASTDPTYVFAQLSKNIENACIKTRRHSLAARRVAVYLKTQDFRYQGCEVRLSRATCFPTDLMPLTEKLFKKIFKPGVLYRATGAVLFDLQTQENIQLNLFEPPVKVEKIDQLYTSIDQLSKRFGKHAVFLGSSLPVHQDPDQRQQHRGHLQPEENVVRTKNGARRFINLPYLGDAKAN